jgi:hypothetical protein
VTNPPVVDSESGPEFNRREQGISLSDLVENGSGQGNALTERIDENRSRSHARLPLPTVPRSNSEYSLFLVKGPLDQETSRFY